MSRLSRSVWMPYVVATLAIGVATAASVVLVRLSNESGIIFGIFFGAVACAAWYGGLTGGILATALSYLTANLIFVRPADKFVLTGTVIAYFFVCLLTVAFSEMARRGLARAMANAKETASILESMPDGYVVIDRDGRITYMNPVAQQVQQRHGPADSQVLDCENFPPTMGSTARAKLAEAARQRSTVEFEHFYRPWQCWFEVKASPSIGGGLAVYFRDVTERKRTEEEQRKLASIVASSQDAIISVNLDETISSWNPGAEKLYGYRAEEVVGLPVSLLSPPGHKDQQLEMLARIAREESTVHFDTVRRAKDGREIPVSLCISPIKDSSGRVVGASKIARDISDRKRAEAVLREADRRKDEFLAVLGHELRNPLAAIVTAAEVLKYVDDLPADVVEIRALIERQAGQMRRLIDDLLDVARITRGKITLRTERIDLVTLARQIADDYRERLREREIDLEVDIPREPIWIEGDSARIAQVLSNLLDNAMKFTDKGGRVTIGATTQHDGRSAIVTVRDTGVGMSPEAKASLFVPFAQAATTVGRSSGGLGLGLALVKGLVVLHGGTVEAQSDGPGTGATFTIGLPVAGAPAETLPAGDNGTVASKHCRALIVEDNTDVSWPIARLLERNGHRVVVACDATQGIELARTFRPDIVFCDIGLPGELDGYDVAKTLRAEAATRSTYLVAVTGFGQEEDRRRAYEAGFGRHMTKPANHAELLALVDEVASARGTSA